MNVIHLRGASIRTECCKRSLLSPTFDALDYLTDDPLLVTCASYVESTGKDEVNGVRSS